MILRGKVGKLTLGLLTSLPAFNRRFKVVRFGKTYKIFKSRTIEELADTEITVSNILDFKFVIYDSFMLLNEYTAEIIKLDKEHNQLLLNVWDSEQMNRLIKNFSIPLTDQTSLELDNLLNRKVFSEDYGTNYKYFISVWIHPDIKNVSDDDRTYAEATLKYSLRSGKENSERRLKTKLNLTKKEAVIFCANVSYLKID